MHASTCMLQQGPAPTARLPRPSCCCHHLAEHYGPASPPCQNGVKRGHACPEYSRTCKPHLFTCRFAAIAASRPCSGPAPCNPSTSRRTNSGLTRAEKNISGPPSHIFARCRSATVHRRVPAPLQHQPPPSRYQLALCTAQPAAPAACVRRRRPLLQRRGPLGQLPRDPPGDPPGCEQAGGRAAGKHQREPDRARRFREQAFRQALLLGYR